MRWYALAIRSRVEDENGVTWGPLPLGTLGAIDLSALDAHNRWFITGAAPFVVSGNVVAAFGDGTRLDEYALSGRERNSWNSLLGVAEPNGVLLLTALRNKLTIHADPTGVTGPKPLMPTHRGELNIHLGGHSKIWSERLPDDVTMHPAWPNIQAVAQQTYRDTQAEDLTLARKWLDNERYRYRLTPERVRDLLIPSDLPKVLPLPRSTSISDDFNRADGSLGANWTVDTGTWDILSNEARETGGSTHPRAHHNTALSSTDHTASIDIITRGSAPNPGVGARMQPIGTSSAYYAASVTFHPRLRIVVTNSAGSQFDIFEDTVNTAETGITIECDGSDISVSSSDRPKQTVTSTHVTSGLHCGMRTHNAAVTLDNFEAADLVAGSDVTVELGVASETDSASSVTPEHLVALGLASETNTALSFGNQVTVALGIASETSSALAFAPAHFVPLNLVTETTFALSMAEAKGISLGLASETDSALATSFYRSVSLGIASENDTALAFVGVAPEGGGGFAPIRRRRRM